MKWSVPRIWVGQRCYILAGGASLPLDLVKSIRGNIIAVKHTGAIRPDADVMLFAGKDGHVECRDAIAAFRGKYLIRRGGYPHTLPGLLDIARLGVGPTGMARLSDDPTRLGGFCTGSSAINLAHLLGAREVVLIGYDMCGGHWLDSHPAPFPRRAEFERHIRGLCDMAPALRERGVRVVNTSVISALPCFEFAPLRRFL